MTCHKIEMLALGVVIAQAASSTTNDVCRNEIADSIDFPIYIHTSCKMRPEGNYLVVFSVINKKVRSGIVASPQLEAFDNPIEVDI